jgi:hypothetical protein
MENLFRQRLIRSNILLKESKTIMKPTIKEDKEFSEP